MGSMKSLIRVLLIVSLLAIAGCGCGCSAWQNKMNKMGAGMGSGDYTVTVWSGGQAVATYEVKNGFVNTETQSDGYFFFVNGKLVRVTGTITIERQ
jgi:ABC-type glycerol-3-phosphate transport system substrate-binding protein